MQQPSGQGNAQLLEYCVVICKQHTVRKLLMCRSWNCAACCEALTGQRYAALCVLAMCGHMPTNLVTFVLQCKQHASIKTTMLAAEKKATRGRARLQDLKKSCALDSSIWCDTQPWASVLRKALRIGCASGVLIDRSHPQCAC